MQFAEKTILLISPERWGTMFVSKHHYAIELAKRGNQIYFLEPPSEKLTERFSVTPSSLPGIYIVKYRWPKWFFLRFHYRSLFHMLMKRHVQKLTSFLHIQLDVVWSFDNVALYPDLGIFGADMDVFFPVDQIYAGYIHEYKHLKNYVFSVSQIILDTFADTQAHKILLPHGLADCYSDVAKNKLNELHQGNITHIKDKIKAGYVGNLLIGEILDREVLQKIIKQNQQVEFHFWGAYEPTSNNLGEGNDETTCRFIHYLQQQPNVVLHGALPPVKLACEIQEMDILILCYNYLYDKNKCSNSHKITEYLSTGKVVVSSRVTAYDQHSDLLAMLTTFDNSEYPNLFSEVVDRIAAYNAISLQIKRINFALKHTYATNIDQIERFLSSTPGQ